jgi:hypothetical protein
MNVSDDGQRTPPNSPVAAATSSVPSDASARVNVRTLPALLWATWDADSTVKWGTRSDRQRSASARGSPARAGAERLSAASVLRAASPVRSTPEPSSGPRTPPNAAPRIRNSVAVSSSSDAMCSSS